LLTRLNGTPVMGCPLDHVTLLRLDRAGGLAPGNKAFKLRENLAEARQRGVHRLVSFGGSWSNHLHALAAIAHQQGFESIGLVRGAERETAMLSDARRWGMHIVKLSREEYRRRNDDDWLAAVERRYAPCLVIPEGGSNEAGVRGCRQIGALINELVPESDRIVLPVGTGATLAGLVAGLARPAEVTGVVSLRGASDLETRIEAALAALDSRGGPRWHLLHEHHCGGFARVTPLLRDFIQAFESTQGVPLEPVYTGKMLLAIHQLTRNGQWERRPVLAIHTGGLQGRRGFEWQAPGRPVEGQPAPPAKK
jgi:1-aminocyclopropane-1-carboxylate deaminase